MLDFSLIEAEIIALAVVWSPVEVIVIATLWAIYRRVVKLSALQEMAPDLTRQERLEAKEWGEETLRAELAKRREVKSLSAVPLRRKA